MQNAKKRGGEKNEECKTLQEARPRLPRDGEGARYARCCDEEQELVPAVPAQQELERTSFPLMLAFPHTDPGVVLTSGFP
jgi:hypothetical protein